MGVMRTCVRKKEDKMPIKIMINGCGRIGRLITRAIVQRNDLNFELVAVNDLMTLDQLAYLLTYDSVHGKAPFPITVCGETLCIGGHTVQVFCEKDSSALRLSGIDVVVEATGRNTHHVNAEKLLHAGARKVVITAPPDVASQEKIPIFVMGVNQGEYDPHLHHIVSNASCTTNCLAPLVKILLDNFGVEEGLMTTVHALTSSQPSVDGPSRKDWRGGRSALTNIIPASTGAALAVTRCLPAVQGKLTGMALRVPVLDVSVVDLTVRLSKETSYEEICSVIEKDAEGKMKGIVQIVDEDLVSSDFIGNTASCVVDKKAGMALNSRFYKLLAWYDNEMGYTHRVVELIRYMADKEYRY